MPLIYLKPGEIYMGETPKMISTVLGSCVAITMQHRPTGWSAVCHAVQPVCKLSELCRQSCSEAYRFVECVIDIMVRAAQYRNIRPSSLEVKLFGGAALMTRPNAPVAARPGVGEQNVITAIGRLKAHGLQMKVANAGGDYGRKIIFDTATGVVLMKRLRKIAPVDDPKSGIKTLKG